MIFVVFEDYRFTHFYPLVSTRPVFELFLGTETLRARFLRLWDIKNQNVFYSMRSSFKLIFQHLKIFKISDINPNEDYFFLSARLWVEKEFYLPQNSFLEKNQELLAFRISGEILKSSLEKKINDWIFMDDGFEKEVFENLTKIKDINIQYDILDYLYHFIQKNAYVITEYFENLTLFKKLCYFFSYLKKNVFIAKDVKFYGDSYINGDEGPVFIDQGTRIYAGTYIEGPCYIGKNVSLYAAKIFSGTSIFDGAKIGCEVQNSIILSYTNHRHSGFVGHSYVGSFVNFGAMSVVSNLKNNYTAMSFYLPECGKIKTNLLHLGAYIGDHVKLSIMTIVYSGTFIGTAVNLFVQGDPIPSCPSFIWGSLKKGFFIYHYDSFIKTLEIVYQRRGKVLGLNEKKFFLEIYNDKAEKYLRYKFLENLK